MLTGQKCAMRDDSSGTQSAILAAQDLQAMKGNNGQTKGLRLLVSQIDARQE